MPQLRIENLSAGYERQRVLDAFTPPPFEAGRVVGIAGPNAAGKSTSPYATATKSSFSKTGNSSPTANPPPSSPPICYTRSMPSGHGWRPAPKAHLLYWSTHRPTRLPTN